MDTKHAVYTTSPKTFRQKTKLFCSRSEKDNKIIFLPKKKFLSVKTFLWVHIMEFSQSRRKFFEYREKHFPSISESIITFIIFSQKKHFSSSWSYRHSEGNFENCAKNYPTNDQKSSIQCTKKINWKHFKRIPFSSKQSYGHVNCSFHEVVDKFSTVLDKSSAQTPITSKKYIFPKTKVVFVKVFLWTLWRQFWHSGRKMCDEGQKFFDRWLRRLRKVFWKKIFSLGKFLWTRRMKLSKTCLKVAEKNFKS